MVRLCFALSKVDKVYNCIQVVSGIRNYLLRSCPSYLCPLLAFTGGRDGAADTDVFLPPAEVTSWEPDWNIKKYLLHFSFPVNHFGWVVGVTPSPLPPHWVKVPASDRLVQRSVHLLRISCPKLIQSKSRCSRTRFATNRGNNIAALPSAFKRWEAAAVIFPHKPTDPTGPTNESWNDLFLQCLSTEAHGPCPPVPVTPQSCPS